MSSFIPCLKKPEGENKYFITVGRGGFSRCDLGNNKNGQRDRYLNVLPNCVGWAIGRFNMIGGYGRIRYGIPGDAGMFIDNCKALGLTYTKAPTLGGIMVWSKVNGAGHVAVVEMLHDDGSVTTSESEYNGAVFKIYRRSRDDGNWRKGCGWMGSAYKYLGCILNPAVEDEMSYDLFKEYQQRYEAEKAAMSADKWAEEAMEEVKSRALIVGDQTGNQRPKSYVTRQELAVVLVNLIRSLMTKI